MKILMRWWLIAAGTSVVLFALAYGIYARDGQAGPRASESSNEEVSIGELIGHWNVANNACRGDSDITACDRRSQIEPLLQSRGYCFGHDGEAGMDRRWEPCAGPLANRVPHDPVSTPTWVLWLQGQAYDDGADQSERARSERALELARAEFNNDDWMQVRLLFNRAALYRMCDAMAKTGGALDDQVLDACIDAAAVAHGWTQGDNVSRAQQEFCRLLPGLRSQVVVKRSRAETPPNADNQMYIRASIAEETLRAADVAICGDRLDIDQRLSTVTVLERYYQFLESVSWPERSGALVAVGAAAAAEAKREQLAFLTDAIMSWGRSLHPTHEEK